MKEEAVVVWEIARLLVAGIMVGRTHEDRSAEIRMTYRFGPPAEAGDEADG